jgi:hypothetical protein
MLEIYKRIRNSRARMTHSQQHLQGLLARLHHTYEMVQRSKAACSESRKLLAALEKPTARDERLQEHRHWQGWPGPPDRSGEREASHVRPWVQETRDEAECHPAGYEPTIALIPSQTNWLTGSVFGSVSRTCHRRTWDRGRMSRRSPEPSWWWCGGPFPIRSSSAASRTYDASTTASRKEQCQRRRKS